MHAHNGTNFINGIRKAFEMHDSFTSTRLKIIESSKLCAIVRR